jgi:hypothetical protein
MVSKEIVKHRLAAMRRYVATKENVKYSCSKASAYEPANQRKMRKLMSYWRETET